MHFQTEYKNQMTVMGHHGPLLSWHFAEQILMAVYLKHLQLKLVAIYILYFHKINLKEQQQSLETITCN